MRQGIAHVFAVLEFPLMQPRPRGACVLPASRKSFDQQVLRDTLAAALESPDRHGHARRFSHAPGMSALPPFAAKNDEPLKRREGPGI
jgi:hypothetical protein